MQGDVRICFSFEILFMSLFSLMKKAVSSSLNGSCDKVLEASVSIPVFRKGTAENGEGLNLCSQCLQEREAGDPPSQNLVDI